MHSKPDPNPHPQAIIRMQGIIKRFGEVTANDGVDFDLFPGEVHTLLGENGAGKSTLMHVLSGLIQPDAGRIEIRGEPATIRSPFDSLRFGIGMVYQHFALVPNLTVIENIVLGFEERLILNRKRVESRVKQIFKEFELTLPLDEKVSNLSGGAQQRVEIVKALFHRSDILILDEPTAVLTPMESHELFKTIVCMRNKGKAVVFITHKLNETIDISDRISILKLGRKVDEISGEALRRMGKEEGYRRIFDVMFDNVHLPPKHTPTKKTPMGKPVLELDRVVCLGNLGEVRLRKVSLILRSGEIFGIAGVDGNGQKEMAEIVAGQRNIVSGRLILEGNDITNVDGTAARSDLGISYITDDRMQEGCALSMSVAENSILRLFKHAPFSRKKILSKPSINHHVKSLIREYDIKVGGPDDTVGTLSGGNIQKLLLARELSQHPKVLVCNKPTQGLDAKTAQYVQQRLQDERDRGAGILLISSDLDELLSYSDRIGVLYNGELLDVLICSDANHENIGKLMLGIRSYNLLTRIRYDKIEPAVYTVLSLIFAFIAGGIILLLIDKNPLDLYGQLFLQGMGSSLGIVETIIKMAPLLIVSAGLLIAFSGGLWNLGVEGQFLMGAMLAGWAAPKVYPFLSLPIYFITLGVIGFAGGMAWALLPAILKARYNLNEIIITLMMNYVALNFVTWLVKGPINDPTVVPAQTTLIPMSHRMPMIPLTRIHIGLVIGLIAIIGVHWIIRRTTMGYQIRVLFANPKAAAHTGMNVKRIIIWSLLTSGGFAGLAGAGDVLAVKGLFQSGWNPMYGITCIALVFLARLNGWAVIPLSYFFSFLVVGGEFVARDQGVPIFFVYVLEGLMLLFFAAGETIGKRRKA